MENSSLEMEELTSQFLTANQRGSPNTKKVDKEIQVIEYPLHCISNLKSTRLLFCPHILHSINSFVSNPKNQPSTILMVQDFSLFP